MERTSSLRQGPRGNPRNPPDSGIAKPLTSMQNSELRMRSVTTTAGRPRSIMIDIRPIFDHGESPEHNVEHVTREEMLKALFDCGIKKEELQGIEIQGKHTVYAVFNHYGDRNRHLSKTLKVRETTLNAEHPNPTFHRKRTTLVRIYNFPIDGEAADLETVIKQYGTCVGKVTPVYDHYGLATGERTISMEIAKDIPTYLYVGKHQIRI